MRYLENNLLLLYLIVNITAEYRLLAPISSLMFYVVLALSVPMLLNPELLSSLTWKKFPELTGMIVVYLVAQFVFQTDLLTKANVLYTITKSVVFAIMMLCITRNFDFYFARMLDVFPFIIFVLLAVGWVYNRTGPLGSLCFGFVNRNVACTLATAGFAGYLFRREKLRTLEMLIVAFLFITIVYGGSRNALAMCILIIIVRYGISFRIVLAGVIAVAFVLIVMPKLGIEVTAFDRLMGTINGTVDLDREDEREVAIQMIAAKPWTGWGYSYASVSSLDLAMNAHNGYLTTIVNLGCPCGIIIIAIIVFGSLKRLRLYSLKNRFVNYHLAIIVSTLFGTFQEDYLVGVNQCTTNLFFVSFAVLGLYMYKQKYEPQSLSV